jgi:hypothetical protein
MAVWMQSISHCTFSHIWDVADVIEILQKTWQRQNCIYKRANSMILCITFALPWGTNPTCSEIMYIWHIYKD